MQSLVKFDERIPHDKQAEIAEFVAPFAEEGIAVSVDDPDDGLDLGWRVRLDTPRWATSFRIGKDLTKDQWALVVAGFLRTRRHR